LNKEGSKLAALLLFLRMIAEDPAVAVLPKKKTSSEPGVSRVKDLARSVTNFRDAHASA
jgi:hypothetical protein